MKASLAACVLLLLIFLISIGTSCASRQTAHSVPKQTGVVPVENPVDTNGQSPERLPSGSQTTAWTDSPLPKSAGEQTTHTADQARGQSIWTQGIPSAIVSVLAAMGSLYYFYKNRELSSEIADRTVSFEAQKLLLEINKQFIADPSLFAIYDDNSDNKKALENDPELKAKVESLGYMKLNVFEIVFARLPDDSRDKGWKGYFLDSLDRCSVLAEELKISEAIYHPRLIEAYQAWAKDKPGRDRRAAERKRLNSESKAAWLKNMRSNDTHSTARVENIKDPGT